MEPTTNGSGKQKKKKRKDKKLKKNQQESSTSTANVGNSSSSPSSTSNQQQQQQQLPLPFPQHLKRPRNDFLRNEAPYQESFQAALKTSYLGLAIDEPTSGSTPPLTNTLQAMQDQDFFQTDVTQPFGLGTKCAKTYVTRCLVGDPGTTYKYLGLRMFAYSWNNESSDDLCKSIRAYKDAVLMPRTRHHLQQLQQQRPNYNYNWQRSRADYNICLINRMDSSRDDYKLEPTFEKDASSAQIAVAWHADSSLEHYSNIAVHQVLVGDSSSSNQWQLAVRTTPHAEGPTITANHPPDPSIPPLALSLASESIYYMLDDFNHHHQHAVLKTNHNKKSTTQDDTTPCIRYSATYRLLRPSHTVQELLQQCHSTTRQFHKKGSKVWRSEQLLLNHLESEWLRQFYIQGQHGVGSPLWNDWKDFVQDMWKYWALLEGRTKFVMELLVNAAYGRLAVNASTTTTKAERKQRDKQRKAWTQIQEVVARSNHASGDLYQSIVELLRERISLRCQWNKRERDHVFTTLERHYRPLEWPVLYNNGHTTTTTSTRSSVMATSPLPEDLTTLVDQLEACGQAMQSDNASDLPPLKDVAATASSSGQGSSAPTDSAASNHEGNKDDVNNKTKKNKKRKKNRQQDDSSHHDSNTKKKKKRRY